VGKRKARMKKGWEKACRISKYIEKIHPYEEIDRGGVV
jgi:hypothetical protein